MFCVTPVQSYIKVLQNKVLLFLHTFAYFCILLLCKSKQKYVKASKAKLCLQLQVQSKALQEDLVQNSVLQRVLVQLQIKDLLEALQKDLVQNS